MANSAQTRMLEPKITNAALLKAKPGRGSRVWVRGGWAHCQDFQSSLCLLWSSDLKVCMRSVQQEPWNCLITPATHKPQPDSRTSWPFNCKLHHPKPAWRTLAKANDAETLCGGVLPPLLTAAHGLRAVKQQLF